MRKNFKNLNNPMGATSKHRTAKEKIIHDYIHFPVLNQIKLQFPKMQKNLCHRNYKCTVKYGTSGEYIPL